MTSEPVYRMKPKAGSEPSDGRKPSSESEPVFIRKPQRTSEPIPLRKPEEISVKERNCVKENGTNNPTGEAINGNDE